MEGPEVHQPHVHKRHGLPQWLELSIAAAALVTSISSIAIAVHHGQIMERLVQANSVPFVIGGFSDITPTGERVLSLDLLNRGVGPAKQRSLRVKVDDRVLKILTAVDLPYGAIRRRLLGGKPPPTSLDAPVAAAARAILQEST